MNKFCFRASMLSVLACSALQASAGVQIATMLKDIKMPSMHGIAVSVQKMLKDVKMPTARGAAIAATGVCAAALVYKAVQSYKQDQAIQRYWSAIEHNDPEALKKVLAEGFDIRTSGFIYAFGVTFNNGGYGLFCATKDGYTDIVKILINAGAKPTEDVMSIQYEFMFKNYYKMNFEKLIAFYERQAKSKAEQEAAKLALVA